MARKHLAAMLVVASVAAACSGIADAPAPTAPTDSNVPGVPAAAAPVTDAGGDITQADAPATPSAVGGTGQDIAPAVDATEPPPQLPETVEVIQPDFVVDAGKDLDGHDLDSVTALPGLSHVAKVARAELRLSGPEADATETIMVVDASDFRPLTPDVTAQAVGVWERLAAGDVIVRHDVAAELGLELGGTILLAGEETSRVARVGAFAANGVPPVAAVLVPWSLGRELGIERPNGLVVAVDDSAVDGAPGAIGGVLDGATVERREPPQEQRATVATGATQLQPFTYTDFGDGTIAIDPAWVQQHIKRVEIPGIATTRCHELMIPQLLAALDEIRAVGLYGHFKPEQFGGCWVARHIDWNPDKPLSNHAWGTAIDFNTHDNWLGETPQMDMRIVEIFEKWGFEWGGHWSRPDGMHFELDRIVRPAS